MQATSYVWQCITHMPIPDSDIHSDFQTLLPSHIFHSSMDIVCASLKEAVLKPMLLAMYAADLPEEQLIACMVKNASPATTIILAQFRDFCPHKPCHRKDTLAKVKALCNAVHPWDITTFQKQVKVVNLLGVHLPYWWDPTYFLVSSSSTLVTKFLMIIQ